MQLQRRSAALLGRCNSASVGLLVLLALGAGCSWRQAADRDVAAAIRERQQHALNDQFPIELRDPPERLDPGAGAYEYAPHPTTPDVPAEFERTTTTQPVPPEVESEELAEVTLRAPAATQPASRAAIFTLNDSLRYAQIHRTEYQTAKEDLYLVALALTLERHLWTPIFAQELRAVYGNFGEIRDFDQAMRFVSNLSVSQRLPYGGEFTAAMINTLVRDIVKGITASETGQVVLGLNIPFLRGAGHVAREQLIQLERDLTYAVRDFERFRRSQLVQVAQQYFDLLRAKQEVIDSQTSLARFQEDFERAKALEQAEAGSLLDTQRAEQQLLSAQNRVEDVREAFRAQSDQFKLTIGMPVDEPLGIDDLQSIESIERLVAAGEYPLLERPAAANNEPLALEVALQRRLDLLNRLDQISDARRGVAVAKNALLPDLNWNSTLTYDTDPEHFNSVAFTQDRATWRSELILSLPLERTAERNQYRAARIDVRRAQRVHERLADEIRADVREALNRIQVEERSLQIQERNLQVADLRREYARIQFYDGDIGNRDLVEAEDEWTDAVNRLNLAKTQRWNAILQFRLATETLRVEESGAQVADEVAEGVDIPVGLD